MRMLSLLVMLDGTQSVWFWQLNSDGIKMEKDEYAI